MKHSIIAFFVLISAILVFPQDVLSKRVAKRVNKTGKAFVPDLTTFNTLLPIYLDAYRSGRDHTAPMTGLIMDYLAKDEPTKKAFQDSLISRSTSFLDQGRSGDAVACSNIYRNLNLKTHDNHALEALYYIDAMHAVMTLEDTVELKKGISDIESLYQGHYNHTTAERLERLKSILKEIREYIPVHNLVNGTWVASIFDQTLYIPCLIFDVYTPVDLHHESAIFKLKKNHCLENGYGSVFKSDSTLLAQETVSFSGDSIYCVWGSESLKNPDPAFNQLFRQTGATFSGALAQKLIISGGGDFASSLLGGLGGSLVELGVNALADEIFNPEKKAILIQMKVKRVNSEQLEGQIFFDGMKVKEGKVPVYENKTYDVVLTRVESCDTIAWWNLPGKFIHASDIKSDKQIKKNIMASRKWSKTPGSSVLSIESTASYNTTENLRMVYLAKQRLKRLGEYSFSQIGESYLQNTGQVIGIRSHPKKQSESGCLIDDPVKGFPAHLAGMKEGDIITHIDGYPVKTQEEISKFISRCEPYKTIDVSFIRGKKEMTLSMAPVLMKINQPVVEKESFSLKDILK